MKSLFSVLILPLMLACTSGAIEKDSPIEEPVPTYPWDECKNDLQSHACNFSAISIDGAAELYDYYRKPIVIELSAMWCGYCQVAGAEADQLQDRYSDDGLVYITVLIENFSGLPPTVEDVQSWKDNLDVNNAPVWASSRDLLSTDPTVGWDLKGWPTFYFIDENMIVKHSLRGYSPQAVTEGIELIIKSDTGAEER